MDALTLCCFGLEGDRPKDACWCSRYKPAEAVDVVSKRCKCHFAQPNFGLDGGQYRPLAVDAGPAERQAAGAARTRTHSHAFLESMLLSATANACMGVNGCWKSIVKSEIHGESRNLS